MKQREFAIPSSIKKCVFAANTSWYLYNFHQGLMQRLMDEGWLVHVVSPVDAHTDKLLAMGLVHHPLKLSRRGTNPLIDFLSLRAIRALYRQINPKVVFNYTPKLNVYSTVAAHSLGIPVVNNITGLGTSFSSDNLLNRIVRSLLKYSQPKAQHVLFQNEDDRKIFVDGAYVKAENTSRIPGSGINLDKFRAVEAPNDGVVRFILVARLLNQKGIREYVQAAEAVARRRSDVEFQLLGIPEPSSPNSININDVNQWHKKGLINYLGSSDDVPSIVGLCDCVVLPSYYREGVPRSLLEAAAMAKPIITTDNVGCRETVEDGETGLLCQPQSVASLALAINDIADLTHAQRISMGDKGRLRMQRYFCVNKVIARYLEILQKIT
ncbi:glycosyltransferase family 4 protein [Agarivorans sp. TSD2052]|uniref:glycosyltransferase family 4 protein n=1 Tax=Agarivorans sp. TSD2052 TaxID=2937286 RepID=UPI00200C385C|nr:glycosyltransferase family 4 protein [Agarivorans sp. TSD2052]UPW20078.1 glycosyltransferase family 4 protein [Agarivorans sp. TSD2052]